MQPIRSESDITNAIGRLLAIEPAFKVVADAAGPVPLRKLPTGYEGLAGIVVSQMVSRASADAIWGRLKILLGDVTPAAVLGRSVENSRGLSSGTAFGLTGGTIGRMATIGFTLLAVGAALFLAVRKRNLASR